jgi:hypothetical protein
MEKKQLASGKTEVGVDFKAKLKVTIKMEEKMACGR